MLQLPQFALSVCTFTRATLHSARPDWHLSAQLPMQQTCNMDNDMCWVHINATIPGHAEYLVTQAIGPQLAQRLYYLVLTHSWSQTDTIEQSAQKVKGICLEALSGNTSACQAVNAAYAQVGL